jgi:hypothetical protein
MDTFKINSTLDRMMWIKRRGITAPTAHNFFRTTIEMARAPTRIVFDGAEYFGCPTE